MKQVIFICRLGGISNLLSDDPRLGIRRSVCKYVQITAEISTIKAVMICGFFFKTILILEVEFCYIEGFVIVLHNYRNP